MNDFCDGIGRGTITPKIKTMNESKKHYVDVFNLYCCVKCGSAEVDVFKNEKEDKLCLKCDDCNHRVIFLTNERREDAKNELKQIIKDCAIYGNVGLIMYLEKRLKELE